MASNRDSKDVPFDMQLKLLMIGDSEVGKTCLIWRYAADSFSSKTMNTIGIDFKIKHIKIDDKRIKLQIWDTAGQERFRTITTSYFRGAQGILLVYDITDRGSFTAVRSWMKQIDLHADGNVSRVLIGNKCDLVDERRVRAEEGEALAAEFNIKFFETSAKESVGVKEAFAYLAMEVKNRILTADYTEEEYKVDAIRLTGAKSTKQPCAC
eukprot:CAMPEP_0184971266 /NCGR_PEP_ID=MMETSP1098-20130426/3527_1 /TAXON_ID=89044 /ORGANISM="Spumella elongata, Strain CCAP 955/1" /LENGTH=209 /DNA_ID=CAMNT_0027493361 /DNA_START=93 /DNA_END=722 /DNA_ORIENTATION=+